MILSKSDAPVLAGGFKVPGVRSALAIAVAAALTGLAPAMAQQKPPAGPVTGGDIPGSFKLPGTDTSVRLGGYVKLDVIYSDALAGVNSQADQTLNAAGIPVGTAPRQDGIDFHARQSRVNILTHTPTSYGSLTTFVEGDFFGADGNEVVSNSHGFRLRHAYGTLGSFGAGQTWTNFMYLPALLDTLDFGGPTAQVFIRQAQVRWTEKFSGGGWSVSLENPESNFTTTAGAGFRPDRDQFPDIVGNVQFDVGKAKLWLAALARNIRTETATASDDKWGGALAFSGVVPIFGQNDLRFYVFGGNSIGRYASLAFFPDAILNASGQILSLPEIIGGYIGYRHFWTPQVRSTFAYSYGSADYPTGTPGTLNEETQSVHVNLIWSPVRDVNIGIEYQYGTRVLVNGLDGDVNRVQFSAQYNF